MSEENHLENILRIMGHDDYDEEKMRHLNMYVASRRLLDNYYTAGGQLFPERIKIDIDNFLNSLPPFLEFEGVNDE